MAFLVVFLLGQLFRGAEICYNSLRCPNYSEFFLRSSLAQRKYLNSQVMFRYEWKFAVERASKAAVTQPTQISPVSVNKGRMKRVANLCARY